MRVGWLFGVQVTLNWLFLLLLLLLMAVGLLPEAAIVFGVVLCHELAHIAVAKSYGLKVSTLELLPFGGVARIDDLVATDPAVEVRVALAGPLFNLALAAAGLAALSYPVEHRAWILFFVRTNSAMACFNLLPALPLDGGRIFRALLTRRLGFRRATQRATQLSKLLAILFTAAGIIGFYYGYMNLTLIVIGFFVYEAAVIEQRTAMYVLIRYLAIKQQELQHKGCLPAEALVASAHTSIGEVVKRFVPQRFHMIWVVDHNGQVNGMLTEVHLLGALFDKGFEVSVGSVLANPPITPPPAPD